MTHVHSGSGCNRAYLFLQIAGAPVEQHQWRSLLEVEVVVGLTFPGSSALPISWLANSRREYPLHSNTPCSLYCANTCKVHHWRQHAALMHYNCLYGDAKPGLPATHAYVLMTQQLWASWLPYHLG
jgi:hypothetical protein